MEGECGRNIAASSRLSAPVEIVLPSYGKEVTCRWTISGTRGERIRLQINGTELDIDSGDLLAVFNDQFSYRKRVFSSALTWPPEDPAILSKDRKMLILYESKDIKASSTSIRLFYTIVKSEP